MDLLDQLPFVTTRIEATTTNGGLTIGTGFFFAFSRENNNYIPLLITNRHVLKNGSNIIIRITQASLDKPKIGRWIQISIKLTNENVVYHPDQTVDLAAVLLDPSIKSTTGPLYIPYMNKSHIATDEEMKHINILHDIIMVGYPDGIMDTVNNLPVFRKGITATNPSIDYNGNRHFLIDATCFPGSSGSPIMSYEDDITHGVDGSITIGPKNKQIKLIGIQSETFTHNSSGKIVPVEIPTQIIPGTITPIPNNLGIVVKASCILDLEPLIPR